MIIAIDGPAGSGKSSVAKTVATRLGFRYLDTGAMYRAVAFYALANGIQPWDEEGVAAIVEKNRIDFAHEPGNPFPTRVLISGEDVTAAVRTPSVDDAVSFVARMGAVREAMVPQQRELANGYDCVVEGRDIGTVVFPDAALKVFLTATPEERARRRAAQQAESGILLDAAGVREALMRRDEIDSTRLHSPLVPADDAVLVDTSELSFEQVVERVCELARERGA